MGLDRAVDDPAGHRRGDDLDGGDLGAGRLVAHGVHHPGRLEGQQAGLLDLAAGLGDPFLDDALLGDGLAEGLAVGDPADHGPQRTLGEADQPHAVVDPARAEASLGDAEAVAFLLQQVVRGDANVLEGHLHVPLGVLVAEDRQVAERGDPGGVQRHDDHRLLPVGISVGVGDAHEDRDRAVGPAGVGRPPLATVDDVLVAVTLDAGLDVAGIGGRHRGFGHGEAGPDLAVEEGHQPLLLLRAGAVLGQHLHVPGVRRVAVEDLGREGDLAHELGQGGVLEVGQAGAPLLVGQEQVPQPGRLRLGLQVLHDLRVVVRIPAVADLLLVDRFVREHLGVHELADLLLQPLNTLARREVHRLLLLVARSCRTVAPRLLLAGT